jgi:hypothetical protein
VGDDADRTDELYACAASSSRQQRAAAHVGDALLGIDVGAHARQVDHGRRRRSRSRGCCGRRTDGDDEPLPGEPKSRGHVVGVRRPHVSAGRRSIALFQTARASSTRVLRVHDLAREPVGQLAHRHCVFLHADAVPGASASLNTNVHAGARRQVVPHPAWPMS